MLKRKKIKSSSDGKRVVLICVGFGISLFLEAYVLGVLLGGWLDARFESKPLFTVAGVFLALGGSFYQLFRSLSAMDNDRKQEDKEQKE